MAHHGDDDKPRIPRWNGDPSRFQHWKDEVRIYKLGENLNVNRSVAARLVGGLSGPARKVGLSMTDEDLFPYAAVYPAPPPVPPAAGQAAGDVPVPPDGPGKIDYTPVNRLGIENLVGRLQNKIVTQAPILKGERMTRFFEQHEYFRRRGERISEYIIRWDESVERLQEAGVDVMKMEDIPGWFFLRGAGLNLERRERVLGQLKDDHYPVEDIKNICIRFFPDIHTNERSTSTVSYGHRPRQALITTPVPVAPAEPPQPQHQGAEEHPEVSEDWSEWQEEEEAAEVNVSDLQNILQDELNGLAGDLEASGDGVEEYLDPTVAADLERACAQVSDASEALQTIRDVRAGLKGRGQGQVQGQARPPCLDRPAGRHPRQEGQEQVPRVRQDGTLVRRPGMLRPSGGGTACEAASQPWRQSDGDGFRLGSGPRRLHD